MKQVRTSKFNLLLIQLKENCLGTEPRKVALSITLGICIGIIPIVGVTFITITAAGVLLKLNQLILQATHILVTPLQIILLPVFLKAGLILFNRSDISIANLTNEIQHSDILIVLQHLGILMLYGLLVWLVFSAVTGPILYRVLLVVLRRKCQ